jgi:hypothetical protein
MDSPRISMRVSVVHQAVEDAVRDGGITDLLGQRDTGSWEVRMAERVW